MYPPQGDQSPPYGSPPPGYEQQPSQPYGTPPGYPPAYNQAPYGAPAGYPGVLPAGSQSNGLAIASMILGIVGFLFGLLTAIPAVITGHMALNRIKQNPALGGRGMAIAGLVLGYLVIAVAAIFIVLIIILAASGNLSSTTTP